MELQSRLADLQKQGIAVVAVLALPFLVDVNRRWVTVAIGRRVYVTSDWDSISRDRRYLVLLHERVEHPAAPDDGECSPRRSHPLHRAVHPRIPAIPIP